MTEKKMKLSEAIREGAKLHPQAFSVMRIRNLNGATCRTCALGAAAAIAKVLDPATVWPELTGVKVNGRRLMDEISYRNDFEQQTREEIADWVESIGY